MALLLVLVPPTLLSLSVYERHSSLRSQLQSAHTFMQTDIEQYNSAARGEHYTLAYECWVRYVRGKLRSIGNV